MPRRPVGFTIIELLVVVAIVGVLVALLLPAVQGAREAARRVQCTNNLKQIALAMHHYHDVHRCFPPGKKGCCWGTWLVYVLPHLERPALYDSWNADGSNLPGVPSEHDDPLRYFGAANRTVTSTWISAYLCPSDDTNAPISERMNGVTYSCTSQNYAANFGNTTQFQEDFRGDAFGGAPFVDIGSPYRGLTRTDPGRRTVGLSGLVDGTGQTLLLSEVVVGRGRDLRGFSWWGDAAGFEAFLTPNSSFPDAMFSPYYCDPSPPNPPCTAATTALPDNYGARSRHPSGVNAAMADGSVRFVRDAIDALTWRALSTTRGAEVISSDSY
ncbi:DUF1559 domain-containing protein [Tautonia plasticadhaerens]|uniref:Type II secretion system protein G n=1 Tax=Tautonia plasticadhaerens TaxID=2527974 RepID=A0A518GUT1_9BACT|nr:DUF1559 domain-containing protein [Tautonia plasticadhaerens]QDV32345.1 Type II secretion system protein G precursor [Tautonia plasticadhaerens]